MFHSLGSQIRRRIENARQRFNYYSSYFFDQSYIAMDYLIMDVQIIVYKYQHNLDYVLVMDDVKRFSGNHVCETFLNLREDRYMRKGSPHMMDYEYEFLCPPKHYKPIISIYETINTLMANQKNGVIYDGEWRHWWN